MSFPEPLPLRLSPKARQDFIDILRYTGETWGRDQLSLYRDKIDRAFQTIRNNPRIGHRRHDLPSTYLAYLVGSHVVIYWWVPMWSSIGSIIMESVSCASFISE